MTWGEAWRLFQLLMRDSSSQIGAALAGWSEPVSRMDLTLRDLYDMQHASKAKRKPTPYPRPWPDRTKTRLQPSADLTQDEIVAALRAAGHTAGLP